MGPLKNSAAVAFVGCARSEISDTDIFLQSELYGEKSCLSLVIQATSFIKKLGKKPKKNQKKKNQGY